MHEAGVEPARPCEHWHLKPASLPIPPLVHLAGVEDFSVTRLAQDVIYHCLTRMSTYFFKFFKVIFGQGRGAAKREKTVDKFEQDAYNN